MVLPSVICTWAVGALALWSWVVGGAAEHPASHAPCVWRTMVVGDLGGKLLYPLREGCGEATCLELLGFPAGDTWHLSIYVYGLGFHGNPLLQEAQAHESFSTIIILKNVTPLSLPTRRAVSMETGVETAGGRGSQVRPFPWMSAGPAVLGPGLPCSQVFPCLM